MRERFHSFWRVSRFVISVQNFLETRNDKLLNTTDQLLRFIIDEILINSNYFLNARTNFAKWSLRGKITSHHRETSMTRRRSRSALVSHEACALRYVPYGTYHENEADLWQDGSGTNRRRKTDGQASGIASVFLRVTRRAPAKRSGILHEIGNPPEKVDSPPRVFVRAPREKLPVDSESTRQM